MQVFKENSDIFIFYQSINFKFLQEISGIIFYIHILPVDFYHSV